MKMAPFYDVPVLNNYLLFCHIPIITKSEKQGGVQMDDLVVGYHLGVLAK